MANANGWGDGASNNDIGWGQSSNNEIGWGSVYSVSSAGSTDIVGVVPSTPLILDTYTGAAVAYSLRKLRNDYSGSAIRVRRSSDNTEQDIAFSGNDLDTQTMLDFVGYNLWTYSEEWDNAVWSKVQLNTTGTPSYIDVETAPDSTLTADKIIENTISATHLTARQFAVTNGVTYNVSVYLKSGGRDARVTSAISTLATYQVDVDLTNGTLSGNTFPTSPVLDSVGSGWYRLSYSVTADNTQTRTAISILTKNGASTNYLGNGTSGVYVWGAQISQTSTVKTYQKTVATAGGNGFVATWYDQSTNANNSTQATAANQAQIVLSGALILDADTNKITSTWTTDRYNLTSGISPNTKYLSISMFKRTATTNRLIHLGYSNSTTPNTLLWFDSAVSYVVRNYMPTSFDFDNISTLGRCIMTSLKNSSNLKVTYRNGVQLTNTSTEAPSTGNNLNVFGQVAATSQTSGQYQEYIYWDSDQEANRVGIETNINTYWNAY